MARYIFSPILFPSSLVFLSLPSLPRQELEKEEAQLFQSRDDILQQSQRLTTSFLEQKGELEGSRRRAEERVSALEGKLTTLQEELDAAGYGSAFAVKYRDAVPLLCTIARFVSPVVVVGS